MSAGLKIVSFRGHNINDEITLKSNFVFGESPAFDTYSSNTIETERTGQFPVFVRSQPDGLRFVIDVQLLEVSQDNIDLLKQWFDPREPQGYLIVQSDHGEGDSDVRRILCSPEKVLTQSSGGNWFKITLRASYGVWEDNEASTPVVEEITASGQTFQIQASGSTRNYPVFTFTPKQLIANTKTWAKKLHFIIVNLSESTLYDPEGLGYPIVLDLSTIGLTASNDIRILLKGHPLDLFYSGNKVWFHLELRSKLSFTLEDSINSTETGFFASEVPLSGWLPIGGYALIGDEAVRYDYATSNGINVVARSQLGTSAAVHSAGSEVIWIQNPDLCLIHDFTLAPAPFSPPEYQPIFNLASSTNTYRLYQGPYFNDSLLGLNFRSGSFRKELSEDNENSQYLIAYDDGRLVVENTPAGINNLGAIQGNNFIIETPVGTKNYWIENYDSGTSLIPIYGYGFRRKVIRTDYTYTRQPPGGGSVNLIQTDAGFPSHKVGMLGPSGTGSDTNIQIVSYTLVVPLFIVTNTLEFDSNGNVIKTDKVFHLEYPVYEAKVSSETETEISNDFSSVEGRDSESTVYTKIRTGTDVEVTVYDVPLMIVTNTIELDGNGNVVTTQKALITENPSWTTVPRSVTRTTYDEELGILRQEIIWLNVYGSDLFGNEASAGLKTSSPSPDYSSPLYRLRFNFSANLGRDKNGQELNSPTEVVEGTGAFVAIDNIHLWFFEDRAPKLLINNVSSDIDLYLYSNAILKNETTGEFIEINFPSEIDEPIELDCYNHTIKRVSDGMEIPFSLITSNYEEWLYNIVGLNEYSFTMEGIGAGEGNVEITEQHRNAWL